MSGLFGGGTSRIPSSAAGFHVLTSAYGIAIPLAYGQVRLSSNLIHLPVDATTSHDTKQRTGKSGGVITTVYTYTAALAMGVCEGPISTILTLYRNKDVLTWAKASAAGYGFVVGSGTQVPWSYLTTNFPAQAVPYQFTAYVFHPQMDLPNNQIQDHSWEVAAIAQNYTGQTGPGSDPVAGHVLDASPKDVALDFLTDLNHGALFPSALIGNWTAFMQYVVATGLFVSPIFDTQKAARDWLVDLMAIANTGFVWSDGVLKAVPYGDVAVTGNGQTYTPNTTPVYDLTDDDFTTPGADPIIVTRNELSTAYNSVQVEYLDRSNNYATTIAVATDQASVDTYGLRVAPVLQYHMICVPAIARLVAQLSLQRSLYIRNSYQFHTSWKFSLLEPMDLITLTDAGLGLNKTPVRITSVEENNEGDLTFTAEDWPIGTASATQYATQGGQGTGPSTAVDPGNTTAPVMFEPPSALRSAPLEIWIAAAGGALWGGADVWFSTDNVTYRKVGSLVGPATYGVLTATLAAGTAYPGTDTTHTLSVDLTTSEGALATMSASDFAQLMGLSLVGSELLAFETAALTSAFKYNLTTLARALYGTAQATPAAIGANYVKCDSSLFKFTIPLTGALAGSVALPNPVTLVGTTVYFKFPAFNLYGGGLQSLAAATAYSHVVGGIPGATASPPTIYTQQVGLTSLQATLQFSGNLGAGAFGPLQWRTNTNDAGFTAWSLAALPQTMVVSYDPFFPTTVVVEVMQGDGQTAFATYTTAGQDPTRDPGTGLAMRSVAMTDGRFSVGADDAGGQQINLATAMTLGTAAAKRIEHNLSGPGTMVLQVQSDGVTAGVKGVLGDYSRPTSVPVAVVDTTWSAATESVTVGPANKSTWVSGSATTNTLAGVSITAYDGIYRVAFTVGIKDTVIGSDFMNGFARVLIEYNKDSGGFLPAGFFGLTTDNGILNSHFTQGYVASLSVPGVASSLIVRVTIQGEYVEGIGSNNSVVVADVAVTSVSWKYLTSGTPLVRRGTFQGAEASMPHFSMEPNTSPPTSAQMVEGEAVWDGNAHALVLHDGNQLAAFKRYTTLLLASDFTNATTAFTNATGLAWAVGAGETWHVELEGFMTGPAAGAVVKLICDQTFTFYFGAQSNTSALGTYASDTSTSIDPALRCLGITGYIKQVWTVVNTGGAGNLEVQLKSGSAATATLKAGFAVRAWRIA